MSTKKLVIIVVSALAGIALLVTLFAGAIVGVVFYSINNSEATRTAKDFLRGNEKLKQDVGEIKDFGYFVTGSIRTRNDDGNASLHLKVIGERRTVDASVYLTYKRGQKWRVTNAFYESETGQTISLLNGNESETPEREPEDEH